MKTTSITVFAVLVLLSGSIPAVAQGEAWTADQKEAWASVVDAHEQLKAGNFGAETFADSYRGWAAGFDAPYTKADRMPWASFFMKDSRVEIVNLFPFAVDIHGDIAIAFYSYNMLYLDGSDEIPSPASGKYVDILRKIDGEWILIADVGFDDE